MLKILMVDFTDELLKNLKVEMKHKTRKRNHTFELIHSDLERRKAMIHNLCLLFTPSNDRIQARERKIGQSGLKGWRNRCLGKDIAERKA